MLMISSTLCRSFLINRLAVRMNSSHNLYEDAIQKLNGLQSNQSTIAQIRNEIKNGQPCTNLDDMERYLLRIGISLSMLDELSVVHIAGTKGKGSTSAMCESILRHHGFRTGFYSSPHLVAVRERIRLDGHIVSKEKFTRHFHQVYDSLYHSQSYKGDMPKYFAFLTVLAFNIFLKEKVDVAIVEVGIGGIVDYTNVLRKVPVVGITALGLDHISILGNTLTKIAAAKAGIIKPGCEAFSVEQPCEAMQVLHRVARQTQCPLYIVPDYKNYDVSKISKIQLPVDLDAYKMNASLAIQLAHAWMRHTRLRYINRLNAMKRTLNEKIFIQDSLISDEKILVTEISNETVEGLNGCKWPGRYQVIETNNIKYYLDGAHTKESMEICAKWFISKDRSHNRILIFSATGDRSGEALLEALKTIEFDLVYFVIPSAYKETSAKNDNYFNKEQSKLLQRCHRHVKLWHKLSEYTVTKINICECVYDALEKISLINNEKSKSVLITGSLHLVGAALSILDPTLVIE